MPVIFDRKSVQITPDFHRAVPDCFIDDQRVDFHLTEGFDPSMVCKLEHRAALAAQGKIRISATQAELAGWDFGFIQVARANNMSTFFAGRTRKEGSIVLQTHLPPALPNPLLLDGSSAVTNPWIRFGRGEVKPVITPTVMAADMTDHPSACAGKVMKNDKTKCDNLLFHSITEYELWTTLCAKDPGGKFQQFAHFHWVVRWDQKFHWRGRTMMKGPSNSSITHDPVVLGPPAEPGVQALLNSPADPVALIGFNGANHNFHKDSPNHTANPDWFHNVPPDFFVPAP